ncbi:MAG: ROK family protein [Anaerolineales bacterium]|nr:ROK family protein [Anaerolineales bacterium]
MKPQKATSGQLRQHNRQLLLRAVQSGLADNRAALSQVTGLAKPTVSDLIGELLDEGLLIETGHGKSAEGGGKRPRLLEFVPDARQVIGVSVSHSAIRGILTNLNGQISAQHYSLPNGSLLNDLICVVNGLVAQLDAPLLCIGVGVPGKEELPQTLETKLAEHFDVPVYIGNNTELAAVAQFAFGAASEADSLVTVLVNRGVEVGYVLGGSAYHSGGDIGELRLDNGLPLEALLSWSYIYERACQLLEECPHSHLSLDDLSYLTIQHAALNGDACALTLQGEIAAHLGHIFAWIIALLKPEHISLAGNITDMGTALLAQAIEEAKRHFPTQRIQQVAFSLATASTLSATGAVAQALQQELGLNG